MAPELRTLTDTLVRDYLGYNGGALVIIYDQKSIGVGESIIASANSLETDGDKSLFLTNLDYYRKGKPLTSLPDDIRADLKSKLSGKDERHNTVLYIHHRLDGEIPMAKELIKFVEGIGRIGGLSNCTADVLEKAYHQSNNPAFSKELYEFLLKEEEVLLTCDRGSDVRIKLDHNKYTLVNSDGFLIPGKYANPIPAEVYAHPVDVEGVLHISGSYGPIMGYERFRGNFGALLEALNKNPIKWNIKNGKVTDVSCGDKDIETFVRREVFEKDTEHGPKIGEFGLPANLYILSREMTGLLLIDEKGRVHIAHGDGYKTRTRCEYESKIHGDGLVGSATLKAKKLNKTFMADNVYSSEIFETIRR